MSFKSSLREALSEPGANGTLSWGRIASSFALFAAITWISYTIYKDPIHHFPAFDGITGFVLAPYASNKVGTAVQAFSSNPVGNKPQN